MKVGMAVLTLDQAVVAHTVLQVQAALALLLLDTKREK
jgi:hypothetical protein